MNAGAKEIPGARYGVTFDRYMAFLHWAEKRETVPGWRDVVTRFDCSRATAYRWLALWKFQRYRAGAEQ